MHLRLHGAGGWVSDASIGREAIHVKFSPDFWDELKKSTHIEKSIFSMDAGGGGVPNTLTVI